MPKGTNLPRMGDFNQTVILDVIRRGRDGFSRAQVARRTGLSAQTVSNICARLLAEGLIVETGAAERPGPGRRGTVLKLNASSRYAVGVHFDPALLTTVVLDLTGAVVAKAMLREPGAVRSERLIGQVRETLDELIERVGIERDRIIGVGLATPGPIDIDQGIVIDPPLLAGWRRVALRDEVAAATGLPTVLDKDVNAAASAHLWLPDSEPVSDFVFFYLGAGMAMATVVGNEVVRGRSANSGDVGNWIVESGVSAGAGAAADGAPTPGPLSADGLPGTLGMLVTARNIALEAVQSGAIDGAGANLESHSDVYRLLGRLSALAEQGDERAVAVISRATRRVAKAAADLARLLDLGTIVLGGPLWSMWPANQINLVQDYLDAHRGPDDIWRITARPSPLGGEVAAIGAGCVLLERAFAPRPAALLLDA